MNLFYNLILVLISISLFSRAQAAECKIPEKINFTHSADGAKFAQLDLQSDWETAQDSKSELILNYKNKVRSLTSVDPKYLINRQRALFKNFPDIVKRMTKIYEDKLGRIDQAGCLETSILSAILAEYPGDDGVEFSVYVLKESKGADQKFRAYILTWGVNHVPDSEELLHLISQDLRDGWQYYVHLHNHPFFFDSSAGDIAGTVVPSEPDFTCYLNDKSKGLQNAWVTNGFSTFKLNSADFDK